jgi:hypothetical protein
VPTRYNFDAVIFDCHLVLSGRRAHKRVILEHHDSPSVRVPAAVLRPPTGPEPPPLFPVVVLTNSTAGDVAIRLVYYKDLETFSRTHPDTTYVVPAADVERLRATLTDGNFTELANGRQAFKVWKQVHREAHVTGWYEASAKEVCPSRFVLFHGMIRGVFLFPALVVSLVSMSIAGRLLQRAPKRERRS